ncbi:Protein phosphatase 2C [Artemisia annua]|uniref:protein-serine/threonine phosphatase n=1 Tax=Artemisia annua TaxID=35608 RepID=A0A2U1L9U5_ARTAN|nr:Protein phosphatase 2C [Artemisia annua]
MEEMATFSIANSLSEKTSLGNHVGFTRVKLLTETASLLSDMGSKTVSTDSKDGTLDQVKEVHDVMSIVKEPVDENLVKLPSVVANSVSLPIVEKSQSKGVKSVYELEYIPLWGTHSVIGKRPEMEDAVAVVPRFMEVPIKMFVGGHVVDGVNSSLTNLTTHFFGVYDGHGGSQVANYCNERVHVALEEELKAYAQETINDTLQAQWEKVFTNCFQKVDDEVGGRISRRTLEAKGDTFNVTSEPVAPATAGSTAVVAVINSSHIIVANCGDSRAVLYRGKEVVVLSNDHKPNREDELARIEAAGGKVIQWNGHRVLGVLAMSRSIGDGYLKPCIIPDPEVTFTARAREDECLVLASDGLWDVMSNEEVCEVARKRILIWHKKNGGNVTDKGNGNGVDHAAQAAADYLVMLALQKGSKDNISVIVVDLKAVRKFKTKS